MVQRVRLPSFQSFSSPSTIDRSSIHPFIHRSTTSTATATDCHWLPPILTLPSLLRLPFSLVLCALLEVNLIVLLNESPTTSQKKSYARPLHTYFLSQRACLVPACRSNPCSSTELSHWPARSHLFAAPPFRASCHPAEFYLSLGESLNPRKELRSCFLVERALGDNSLFANSLLVSASLLLFVHWQSVSTLRDPVATSKFWISIKKRANLSPVSSNHIFAQAAHKFGDISLVEWPCDPFTHKTALQILIMPHTPLTSHHLNYLIWRYVSSPFKSLLFEIWLTLFSFLVPDRYLQESGQSVFFQISVHPAHQTPYWTPI